MTAFYAKQSLNIVKQYRAAGGAWPAKKSEMAEWALLQNLWAPSRDDIRRMCADAIAEAMREETFTDESGRSVRAMLPAKTTRDGEQGTFGDDLRTAPIGHVRIGVTQHRNGIAAESYHLFNIVRYANEHRPVDEQITLDLNFTADVRELDQPVTQKRQKRSGTIQVSVNERRLPFSMSQHAVPQPSSASTPHHLSSHPNALL